MLISDLLSCQSKTATWAGVRANKNKFYYYEIHFVEAGLTRFGWSLANASLDLGTDRAGYGGYGEEVEQSSVR